MNLHNLSSPLAQSAPEWQLLNEATLALRHATDAESVVAIIVKSLKKLGFQILGGTVEKETAQLNISIISHTKTEPLWNFLTYAESEQLKGKIVSLKELSFFEQVILRGETIFYTMPFHDVKVLLHPALANQQPPSTPCSCILAPLREKDTTTHLLVAAAPNIDTSVMPVITAFSNLGSTILENLRLLQKETEQRRISQTLQNVSAIVNSSLNLETVLNVILEQLAIVVPYDSAAIMLEHKNVLKLEAGRGFAPDADILDVEVPIDTNVLYNEMKETHRPIVIGNVHTDPRYMLWEGTSPIHSWIGTPIVWQEVVIGQISIDNFEINAFSAEQAELALLFAKHVATAINNARLFRQAQRTAEEQRALLNSARDVASSLEPEKVLNAIAARVNELMKAHFTGIFLQNDDQRLQLFISLANASSDDLAQKAAFSAAEHAVTQKKGLIIKNPTIAEKTLPGAFLAVPFIIMERVIGAMVTYNLDDSSVDTSSLNLLNRFALHSGIAIENSRLYAQVERRLKRQALLNRLSRRLSSKLSLKALARDIMQTAQTIAEADASAIVLVDVEDNVSFVQYSHDLPEHTLSERLTTPPGVVEKVLAEQRVVLSNTYEKESFAAPPWLQLPIHGIIAVPLSSGDEPLGVLGLFTHQHPIQSTTEILNTVEAIGRQAGVAIENALLFQQVNNYAQNLAEQVEERTAEIRTQKEQTEAILAAAGDTIIITNSDGLIEYVNPAFTTLTGYYPEEVIGKNPSLLQSGQTPRRVYAEMWQTILGGRTWRGEMKNKCKDGRLYDAELTISPIFDPHGSISKFVGIQRDITKLRELDRMKTEFLGTAAHELRSPLTTLQGYAELLMLRSDFSPDEVRRFVGYIHEQAVHLANLVSDLLDVSKIESGAAFPIKPVEMNPREIFVQTVNDWQLRTKNHNIQLVEPDEWPRLKIDKARLTQTLNNLLSNAIKYSPNGGDVTIVVRRTPINLLVSVADNGIGMSTDEQQHVFEKFWRADASSTAIEGTGLGMVIVKHIIESHGGKIWLMSKKGKGTTIKFTLPVGVRLQTVLVIEDDPNILDIERHLLENEKYHVISAEDGEEGLNIAFDQHPDLIILDLMLPEMTGEEVLRRLKNTPATKNIPVVVVSAKSGLAQIEQIFSLGATDFITKPFSTAEYASRIKLALSK